MKDIIDISTHYYNKGLSNFKNKNIDDAICNLNKSIEIFPKEKDTLNLLGCIYYIKANFNNAIECWKDSLKISPEDNKAKEYLKHTESEDFNRIVNTLNNSIKAYENQEYDLCIKLAFKVVEYVPEIIETYEILASSYINLNNYKDAEKYVIKIKNLDVTNEKVNYLEKIISNKSKTGRYSPNKRLLIGWSGVIIVLLFTNIYGSYYKNTLKNKSDYEQSIYKRTISQVETNNRRLQQLNDELMVQLEETIILEEEENIKSMNDAINLAMDDERNTFNISLILFKDGNYVDAVNGFEDIIYYGVEVYLIRESTYYAALSYERENDIENAVKWYEQYIANYKDGNYYDDSLYNYGLLLYKSGYIEDAKTILTMLVEEVPYSIFINSKTNHILNSR